ncbi:unnamed protein product, partial [Iphiclides podalirius]
MVVFFLIVSRTSAHLTARERRAARRRVHAPRPRALTRDAPSSHAARWRASDAPAPPHRCPYSRAPTTPGTVNSTRAPPRWRDVSALSPHCTSR